MQRLGWKQPKILNAGDPYQSLTGLIGNLSLNDISAFVMMVGEYELSLVMDLSHKVILLAPDSDMDRVARIVQQKGAGWSNLLVSNSPETSAAIEEKLSSLKLHPRGLFLLECGKGGSIWMLQTTVGDRGIVKNEWIVGPDGKFVEDFNQQGLEIYISTMSWSPFFTLYGCDENEQFCKAEGAFPQAFELIGRMNNFTWRYDKEPSGKWGTTPKTGTWADPNATFEGRSHWLLVLIITPLMHAVIVGLYGRTINGELDIPLSSWGHFPDRYYWTECTLAIIPNSNQVSESTNINFIDVHVM